MRVPGGGAFSEAFYRAATRSDPPSAQSDDKRRAIAFAREMCNHARPVAVDEVQLLARQYLLELRLEP